MIDYSSWKKAAEAQLKGADFEKSLYTQTLEGIQIAPLYTSRPLEFSDIKRPHKNTLGWQINQKWHGESALDQGIEAFEIDAQTFSDRDWQTLKNSPFRLWISSTQPHLDALRFPVLPGHLLADPFSEWLHHPQTALESHFESLAQAWSLPTTMLQVSGFYWHQAGAHAVQELAYTLASWVDSIEKLHALGLNKHDIWTRSRLVLSSSPELLMNISKLRALRYLLAQLAEVYQTPVVSGPHVHAHISHQQDSRHTAHNHLIRQSIGAFSAVLGGADSLYCDAFDEDTGSSPLSQRLTRTLQQVLKYEAHLDQLLDPVGGSYAIEQLTQELAKAAWTTFQDLESQGGWEQCLRQQIPQVAVAKVAAQRQNLSF